MKLFSKLLGKKAEPETLDRALERLKGASPAEVEALVALSNEGTDSALRLALIPQLNVSDTLFDLACSGKAGHDVEKAARQRLAQLLEKGSLDEATLIQRVSDVNVQLAIAAMQKNRELEARILASISDQTQMTQLCVGASSAAVRQALVERIDDIEQLKLLQKEFKQRDKNVYKIAKGKLDAHRAEEATKLAQQEKITSVLEEAQQLAQRQVDKEYEQRCERVQRRWAEVSEGANAAQQSVLQEALDQARAKLDTYLVELEAERALARAKARAGSERQQLLDEMWACVQGLYALEQTDETALQAAREALDGFRERWQTLASLSKPAGSEAKDYVNIGELAEMALAEMAQHGSLPALCDRVRAAELNSPQQRDAVRHIKRLLYPLNGFDSYAAVPESEAAHALLAELDSQYHERKEQYQKNIRSLGGLIRRAQQAVEQGRLKQAVGMRHAIDEKLTELDGAPTHISRQMESLDEALQKLIDWQAYAVVPKKEALIDAMQGLVGAELPPDALATKIKHLQDEWKELRQAGTERNEALWEKFSALADQAFEPCKVYFEQLGNERQENLQKRQQLVTQLAEFLNAYDWENADWKHVEKILRGARAEFHSYAPVERAANKPVAEQLDQVLDQLQAKLNGEFEKNKTAKQQLIQQAEKLVGIADMQQAIDTAKRLQMQWKTIGRSHFREDEQLWKSFRGHCDALFAKKDAQENARRAEADQRIADGRAVVDALKALCQLEGEALLAARAERDELAAKLTTIEGIPEKVQHALERDLSQAAEQFDRKVAAQLRVVENTSTQAFFDFCQQLNAALASGSDGEALTALQTQLDKASQWPEGTVALLKTKLQQVPKPSSDDTAMRQLCIRAEIAADKASPEADKALRMEYQVKMLQQGLGMKRTQHNSRSELARDWAAAAPVSDARYRELQQRFYAAWLAIKG